MNVIPYFKTNVEQQTTKEVSLIDTNKIKGINYQVLT